MERGGVTGSHGDTLQVVVVTMDELPMNEQNLTKVRKTAYSALLFKTTFLFRTSTNFSENARRRNL